MPRALVKPPSSSFARGITSQELGVPSFETAVQQHLAYQQALKGMGFELVVLPADDYPDSCFVEDMAVLGWNAADRSSGLLLAGRSPLRSVEQLVVLEALRTAVPTFREVAIQAPAQLDGGDVLRLGRRWFVGLSQRTNRQGFEQLAAAVATWLGDEAFLLEVRDHLHLKTGVTGLDDRTVLGLRSWCQIFEGLGYRAVEVEPDDWHAANVVENEGHVLLPAGHPRVRRRLEQLGYIPIEVDLSEFKKQDGGASCLSLLLP